MGDGQVVVRDTSNWPIGGWCPNHLFVSTMHGPWCLNSTQRHSRFLKSTCHMEGPSDMIIEISEMGYFYNTNVIWGQFMGHLGHRILSNQGQCHFFNST